MDSLHLPWRLSADTPGEIPLYSERRLRLQCEDGRVIDSALFDEGEIPPDTFALIAALQRRLRLDDDHPTSWQVTLNHATGRIRIRHPSLAWKPVIPTSDQDAALVAIAWHHLGFDLSRPWAFAQSHEATGFPLGLFIVPSLVETPRDALTLLAHQAQGTTGQARSLGFRASRSRRFVLGHLDSSTAKNLQRFLWRAAGESSLRVYRDAALMAKGRLALASRESLTTALRREQHAAERFGISLDLLLDPDSP